MPDPGSWMDEATATAKAAGYVHDDGRLSTTLASPLAAHCNGLTPEQLLAAAFASCLHHAAVEAAGEITNEAHTVQVSAQARLGRDDDGRYRADVNARIASAGSHPGTVADLVAYADRLWPFSSRRPGRHRLRPSAGRDTAGTTGRSSPSEAGGHRPVVAGRCTDHSGRGRREAPVEHMVRPGDRHLRSAR